MSAIISFLEKFNKELKISSLRYETRGRTQEYEGQPVIVIDNQYCYAVIAFQGAQVLEFQRRGHAPLLWLSNVSNFSSKRAIRGGIPLCFPWFGKHPTDSNILSHGFARNLPWALSSVCEDEDGHILIYTLQDYEETRLVWPYAFNATLEIRVGRSLDLKFSVINNDKKAFDFTFAFHSYFAVGDIEETQIIGLENTPFFDQLAPEKGFNQTEDHPIRIRLETDRIYQHGAGHYEIKQNNVKQRTLITSKDSSDVIVWNPWIEKTASLGDMHVDAWQKMLCVECGQVGSNVVTLDVGQKVSFNLSIKSDLAE